MAEQTPADVIARLIDPNGDDPCSTAEPVTLPGIAELHQERGEHRSAASIRLAVDILERRRRFYVVRCGDEDRWVVMRDDPINGTPVWRFEEFPPSPARGEDACRLADLLNDAAGFEVSPKVDADTHDREMCEVLAERDRAEEWADKLAFALGGPAIGEHSSMNNPWQNALDNPLGPRVDADTRAEIEAMVADVNDRVDRGLWSPTGKLSLMAGWLSRFVLGEER